MSAKSFCFLILLASLFMVPFASAASVAVSQSGVEESNVVHKSTYFTITVDLSGISGSGTVTLTSLPSGFSSDEGLSKSFSEGASTVTWTTAKISQELTSQTISAQIETTGEPTTVTSSQFDVVPPPSLSITVTPTSYDGSGGSISTGIQVNIQNVGGTSANSIVATISTGTCTSASVTGSTTQTKSSLAGGAGGGGESWSTSWPVSGTISSSCSMTVTVTSANTATVSDTISVTGPSGGGQEPEGPGTTGPSFGPGAAPQNATRRPILVPGVGLRNNTKLLEAIEKVLAKGKLSDQARENLLRLSASITSDLSTTRAFNYDGSKSKITTRMTYAGTKKAKNFMLYETVPKTFANNANLVTVTASGATVEVAEQDPSWVMLYPEINPSQEITITYVVSGAKSNTVLDNITSEIYAESLEEAPTPTPSPTPGLCTAGTKRCADSNLQQCSSDGTRWETLESCTYGCDSATLKCKAAGEVVTPPDLTSLLIGIVLAALVVIAAVVYVKKFRGKGGKSPVSALESVKKDLGQ